MTSRSDSPTAEPIAWIGFPADQPKPKYDIVYSAATRLPGYKYVQIWAPQDHPQAVKDRKGESVQ